MMNYCRVFAGVVRGNLATLILPAGECRHTVRWLWWCCSELDWCCVEYDGSVAGCERVLVVSALDVDVVVVVEQ